MNNIKDISLLFSVILWGILSGAILYSHVAFFPSYLHHLPASTDLISGPYGIHDEKFWMSIHPVSLSALLFTLILNRRSRKLRPFMLYTTGIYLAVLIVTFVYFVPELKAFAESAQSAITPAEWLERGKNWERFSWIRGCFMLTGFLSLLIALYNAGPAGKKLTD